MTKTYTYTGTCQTCGADTSRPSKKRCRSCADKAKRSPLPEGLLLDECFRVSVESMSWHLVNGRYLAHAGGLLLHQFIWKLAGRPLPEHPLSIDHSNQNKLDNRLENLRIATRQLQAYNTGNTKRKTHNLPRGVYWDGRKKKPYFAKICHRGKQLDCGYYSTPEEAAAAYEKKRAELMSLECSLSSPE